MHKYKSIAQIILAIILILLPIFHGTSHASNVFKNKYASIVIDADTKEILYSRRAKKKLHPASLTKMMTLYLLFEQIKRKKMTLNSRLRVSYKARIQPPSKVYLHKNRKIKVRDSIMLLITKSANDVAVVVAENVAGSVKAFARRMTQKARKLGMKNTVFRNSSGLYHRYQYSTAYDMSILSYRLIKDFPKMYKLFKKRSHKYRGKKYFNHNTMLNEYYGTDGLKTGYIKKAGYNVALSVKRGKKRLIAVIFGARNQAKRSRVAKYILNKSFAILRRRNLKKIR